MGVGEGDDRNGREKDGKRDRSGRKRDRDEREEDRKRDRSGRERLVERQGWEKEREIETGKKEKEWQGRQRKNYKHKKIHGILSCRATIHCRASIRLPVIITLSASAKHCLYYDIVL